MANKSIKELPKATQIQEDDALPMQQGSTTKQVTGLTLTLWLLDMADGHGGVTDFQKLSESGLEKTYQFTMADTTKYTFTVTDGNGVADFQHSVSGLVHTYKLIMDNGQEYTMTIKDGEKGDKGDNAYLWYKFASEQPTSSSSSMGDEPDAWMGVHSSHEATAPTDPMEYTWVRVLGNTGPTGAPATLIRSVVEYQVSTSGTVVPSGYWSETIPTVPQGAYLWTRTTIQFNTGGIIQLYTNSRNGLDGLGSVVSINNVSPGENGNVELTADDVGAVDKSGDTMEGPLHMNGQVLDGLNDPTKPDEAVRKAYVDKSVKAATPVNILDNSDFTHFIAQAGLGGNHGNSVYAGDRWVMTDGSISGSASPDGLGFTDISISANKGSYCNLYQKLGNFSAIQGDPYTVALYDGSSIYVGNFKMGQQTGLILLGVISFYSTSGTNILLRIPQGQTASIKWVMVIPGTYTADTLPNYPSKGYAEELAQCQMYYKEISLRGVTGFVDNVTTNATFKISESEMRINPTAKILEVGNAILHTDALGSVVLPITSVVSVSDNGTVVTIAFTQQSGAIAPYSAISVYSGSVALSADL